MPEKQEGGGTIKRDETLFSQIWYPGETPGLITDPSPFFRDKLNIYGSQGSEKDRSLEYSNRVLGFHLEDIPLNGSLLVIGAGVGRRFERETHDLRPDIHIASIDPLLKFGIQERLREAVRTSTQRGPVSPFDGKESVKYGVRFPHEIQSEHPYYKPAAVAGAIAVAKDESDYQGLSFRDEVFDSVVGLHSVPQYLPPRAVSFMLHEVVRVLKQDATARFYPFFPEDIAVLTSEVSLNNLPIANLSIDELIPGKDVDRNDWKPDLRRVVFQRAS